MGDILAQTAYNWGVLSVSCLMFICQVLQLMPFLSQSPQNSYGMCGVKFLEYLKVVRVSSRNLNKWIQKRGVWCFWGGCFGGWGCFVFFLEIFSLVDGAKTFLIDNTACTSSGDKLGILICVILLAHRDECL